MIAYVRGILACTGPDFLIVEAGGIGYQIFVSASALQRLPAVGQEVKLYTYHHVREDAMLLYGFLTLEEQEIFMHLINISGIGPKGALTMLGVLQPRQFLQALAAGDINALTHIPGVGKKTAQRLILELKDKLAALAGEPQSEWEGSASAAMTTDGQDDAYEALIALGYTAQEAARALAEVRRQADRETSTDVLVRQALRVLMTREVR